MKIFKSMLSRSLTAILLFLVLIVEAQNPGDVFSRTNFDQRMKPFYHGVASGDPLPDRVIIWTRITPGDDDGPKEVGWEISEDIDFNNIINFGNFTTDRSRDFTVKIDVDGLRPNQWYFFRFSHKGIYSIIGRTRTAPLELVDSLRFAVVSCSDYVEGYFHVYARIAERNDVDGVIHLGDYIYENRASGELGRPHYPPKEIVEVQDYRQRYSQYRLDKDLRRIHQLYPFINVWDDHETSNNSWFGGAEGHTEETEGSWERRKKMALRAYDEWMPVRRPIEEDTVRIYRSMKWSDLLNINMIDTRLIGRDEQVGQIFDFENAELIDDTSRHMMGKKQLEWLSDELINSSAQWQFIGQQVLMAPLEIPVIGPVNWDAWAGYRAERNRLYNTILNGNVENVVVLTGDIHTAWANNLKLGNQRIGVEFVVPSVTKQNAPFDLEIAEDLIRGTNHHINYVRISGHGYYVIDINQQRVQTDYYFVGDTKDSTDHSEYHDAGLMVNDKERKLHGMHDPAVPRSSLNIEQPPAIPQEIASNVDLLQRPKMTILGLYPNPAQSEIVLEIYLQKSMEVNLMMFDISERAVFSKKNLVLTNGLNFLPVEVSHFQNGTYQIRITTENQNFVRTFVKM